MISDPISSSSASGLTECSGVWRGNIEHSLKSWPQFFERIVSGEKTHELRCADRNFRVGDIFRLQEFDPKMKEFTGREHRAMITYITSVDLPCALSHKALHPDFCILSIKLL